jgi:hypothetical protein
MHPNLIRRAFERTRQHRTADAVISALLRLVGVTCTILVFFFAVSYAYGLVSVG